MIFPCDYCFSTEDKQARGIVVQARNRAWHLLRLFVETNETGLK